MRERLNDLHNQLGRDVYRERKYMRAFFKEIVAGYIVTQRKS